jgi:hypothetical protein
MHTGLSRRACRAGGPPDSFSFALHHGDREKKRAKRNKCFIFLAGAARLEPATLRAKVYTLRSLAVKPELLRKLHADLERPIETEPDVVYLLCELRKLIDAQPVRGSLNTLKFYCHWALHIELTHSNWVRPFIAPSDEFLAHRIHVKRDYMAREDVEKVEALLSWDQLRRELWRVLKIYKLSQTLCAFDDHWRRFLIAYSGVVNDGRLIYKGYDLKVVEELCFNAFRRPPQWGDTARVNVSWTATIKQSRDRICFSLQHSKQYTSAITVSRVRS